MELGFYASSEQLDREAAQRIIDLIHNKPGAILGLATGSTPLGVYEHLISACRQQRVSFRQAVSFNLDEYVGLPSGHSESYRSYMNKMLFRHVDFDAANTHLPDGNAPDLEQECARYDLMIKEAGYPDLQILGLGHNGHIGFNEPDQTLSSRTHVVRLSEQTRHANARFFPSLDEVPTQAITMGVGTILKSKRLLLIVKGSDKADIVHRALTGPITTELPASLLQTHPELTVMMDEDAAVHFNRNYQR